MNKEFWEGKKVFVTGHTGFKGAWLTFWLKSMGAEVCGYSLEPETKPNLFDVLELSKEIEHNIGDIRDSQKLKSCVEKFQPEVVLHLAAQALVRRSYDDPLETFETNVMGTANLLNACRKIDGLKSVVIITTDKCYKNREWEWPYRESDTLGGHDPYSNSKACAELVTDCFRDSFFQDTETGPVICSARAGNVVGGGDWSVNRLIPDMIRAVGSGETMLVRSPSAVRPWQHVLDSLHGYLSLAEKSYNDASYSGSYNFGPTSSETMTVLDILKKVKESLGDKFKYDVQEDPQGLHEAGLLRLDSSKAQSKLGWGSSLNIQETIEMVVGWYSEYESHPVGIRDYTLKQIQSFEKGL